MGNLYGHVENVWGIPFAKRKVRKCEFLGELLQEYYRLTTIDCKCKQPGHGKSIYGHVENVWGIPFAETKERECEFLVELLQE